MNRTLTRLTRLVVDPAWTPDGLLLDAFLAGRDGGAFEALVRRHGPMVLAVCRRVLQHHQDAEDAFQATFLVLARRAADVWPRDALGSWLYGVAYRVALKARTSRARRVVKEQPLGDSLHPAAAERPDADLREAVDRAIRKLPEVYRAAVVACDLEGRSRKEAAEQLGWKEGTLSGRLARARELLAARLRRAGLTLPAGGVAVVMNSGTTADAVSPELCGRVVAFVAQNSTAGVSAPVAALTEGVVRTMFLTKIKTASLAVLTAGAIGFSAWASAGAGDRPGSGLGGEKPIPVTNAQVQKPMLVPETIAPPGLIPPSEPVAKATGDQARMQGRWRVNRLVRGDAVLGVPDQALFIDVVGDTMVSTNTDGKNRDEIGTFVLHPDRSPAQIDLRQKERKVTLPGIYRFTPATGGQAEKLTLAVAESGQRPTAFEGTGKTVEMIELVRVADDSAPGMTATPAEVQKRLEEQKARLDALRRKLDEAEKEFETAKAGTPPSLPADLQQLQGRWRIDSIGTAKMDDVPEGTRPPPVEIRGHTLSMQFRDPEGGWKRSEYTIAVDGSKSPKTIDLISPDRPLGRGIYEFESGPGEIVSVRIALGTVRPTGFKSVGGEVTVMRLIRLLDEKNPKPPTATLLDDAKKRELVDEQWATQLRKEVDAAVAELFVAQAGVEQAKAQVAQAEANLARAKAQLDAAQKRAAEAEKKVAPKVKPAPPGKTPTCTIHIRPANAPEEVIVTELGATDTVLDVLARVKDKVTPGPAGVTVWVVRETDLGRTRAPVVMRIDFDALTQRGETKTNFQIKNGDRVFIQLKGEK